MRSYLLPAAALSFAAAVFSVAACSSDPAAPADDAGTRVASGGTSSGGAAGTPGAAGSPAGDAGATGVGGGDVGTAGAPSNAAYPPGPYGTVQGTTIADITFSGLRNPKLANYNFGGEKLEPIALHDYYNPSGDPSKPRALLIAASAGWCGPCRLEATDSMANYNFWQPKGAEFLTALFDSNTPGTPAAPADATSWSKSYKLEYPMVLDPSQKMGAYANLQAVPFNLVIDLKTMTIVYAQAAVFDASESSPTLSNLLE